jgi:exopolysaccharide biosynthesis polyprenyl glycosylphosphotransferase
MKLNTNESVKQKQFALFELISSNSKARPLFGKLITYAQVLVDFITVFCTYIGSYLFYTEVLKGHAPQSFQDFIWISLGISLLYIIILERNGLYFREISLLNIKEMRGVFKTGIFAAAIILSASFYIRFTSLSRIMFTTAMISAPILLYIERMIFYKLHILFHLKGISQTKVFIYGAGNIGTQLAKRLFESPTLGMLPVGFLDDDVQKHGTSIKWIGVGPKQGLKILGGKDLIDKAGDFGVEHVLIALPSAKFEHNKELVEKCLQNKLHYSIVPNSYESFIQEVEMSEIGGIPLLSKRKRKQNIFYHIFKRFFDFIVALILIILLSPLYIIFGILIKLDSKGPIIFKQKRIGKNGKEFSFYKFRTMYVDAPKYSKTPTDPMDPRITKIGRYLRRTSLDELPQLFNVLRGDMSLVGPRPEMPFIVAQYTPLERRRLEVKPGITGVWQISAARGEPIHANLEYDLFYIENQSFLLDIAILIKTFTSVIRGIGAI